MKHPRPYKLQWLNESGEVKVIKQALVSFSIGRYFGEVFCDVVPMHAGHILLERSWEFDRKTIEDGFTKRYSLVVNNKPISLVHLKRKHVYEDQLKLKRESERKESELKIEHERSKENEKENENENKEFIAKKEKKGKKNLGKVKRVLREKKRRQLAFMLEKARSRPLFILTSL